jgi:hypothetical protein
MNERFKFANLSEPEVFDRLVDGELSQAEEQAILAALDARPDGWRRCALAFLQARAWKDGLGTLTPKFHRKANATLVDEMPTMPSRAAPHMVRNHNIRLLTVAASLGIAFFLGIFVNSRWMNSGNLASDQRAAAADNHGNRQGDATTPGSDSNVDGSDVHVAAKPTVTMALVDNQGDVAQQFQIPLIEAEQLNPRWLARHPAAVSRKEVELLEDRGYRVDQERFYVPIRLEDGRQAIVSFDRAAVKYDGMQF